MKEVDQALDVILEAILGSAPKALRSRQTANTYAAIQQYIGDVLAELGLDDRYSTDDLTRVGSLLGYALDKTDRVRRLDPTHTWSLPVKEHRRDAYAAQRRKDRAQAFTLIKQALAHDETGLRALIEENG